MLTLAACGGGGAPNGNGAPGTLSGTLAYVPTECREDAGGITGSQALHIRRAESEPVAVMEIQLREPVPDPLGGLCLLGPGIRYSPGNGIFAAFQRIGVSPDGAAVVFEITDDFSVFAPNKLAAPEQEGFFFVRSDGSGLRRLGPARGAETSDLCSASLLPRPHRPPRTGPMPASAIATRTTTPRSMS